MKRVAVYGGGVAAAMAALAIARAFSRRGVEVTWVDTGDAPLPHAALIAPPDLATFHRLLGIDEADLVRHAAATFNMGQQFAGWSGGDGAFLHAYGDAGTPFASLPFVQHWTRARAAGLRVGLEDFCLAAAAAKEGRTGGTGEASGQAVKRGWHLDTGGYARLLRGACEKAGVRIAAGRDAVAQVDGGKLTAFGPTGGERVDADLFVDTDGALIAALDPGGARQAVPVCDRILRASG